MGGHLPAVSPPEGRPWKASPCSVTSSPEACHGRSSSCSITSISESLPWEVISLHGHFQKAGHGRHLPAVSLRLPKPAMEGHLPVVSPPSLKACHGRSSPCSVPSRRPAMEGISLQCHFVSRSLPWKVIFL